MIGPRPESEAPAQPAAPKGRTAERRWRYLRAFFRALVDEKTYDVRSNPSLWLGFLLAMPIPITCYIADAPVWLFLLSLPAPATWGVLLGAAGRVGLLAQEKSELLEEEVVESRGKQVETVAELEATQEVLAELRRRREEMVADLRLARAVQSTLESPNIQRPDCEVVIRSIPTAFVGGDYVHAVVAEERWLYVILGDVSGHGVAAALVVARLHGLVRRLTLTKKDPLTIIERINKASLQVFKETYFFLTMAIARIDLHEGILEFATAGHPGQFLIRSHGEVEEIRTRNRLLGMDDDVFAEDTPSMTIRLQPGDTLVFFSDGLFEALTENGEILGEAGLRARIERLGPLEPSLLVGEILQELSQFTGTSTFDDDVSLVATRWIGRTADQPPVG